MCGINGIFTYRDGRPIDRDELVATRDHMRLRGPDGAGAWIATDGRCGLGHRRLSIIDLSDGGSQPMTSSDGRLVVTFNGEIYNYRAIRERLAAQGAIFRSQSDTEVLLHLYAEKGEAMVHELRGMFAFAIWDGQRRTLLLARDPYGIKPLYWADDGVALRFASQVKALLAGGAVATDPDPAAWVGFYMFGHVPEPFTTSRAVRALPAGTTMIVDAGGACEPRRYHSIAAVLAEHGAVAARDQPSPAAREELTRAALLDSVRHHLVADVPVGAFLSAGVDSGALVGLMRDCGQQEIQSVTLAFADFRGTSEDEAPLAAEVARRYGTRHTTRTVTEAEFTADLPRIFAAMDQPSIDGINTWFVSKAASELGLKVAVSGVGGDELFGGYPSFRDIPRWLGYLRLPARAGLVGPSLRRIASAFGIDHLAASPKASALLEHGIDWAGIYLVRRGLFMPWELPHIIDPDLARAGLAALDPIGLIRREIEPDPGTAFGRVAALESALYMRNQLLRDTDWASMAHSLEVRTPLVDATLLARLARLGPAVEQPVAKRSLAVAPSTPLPREVVERPKTGFGFPVETWMQRSATGAPLRIATARSRDWAHHVAGQFQPPASLPLPASRGPAAGRTGGLRLLMLVSDAHGGFGGIARHNCDVLDALAASDAIAEVVVVPRIAHGDLGALPPKVRYDLSGTAGIVPFLKRSAVQGLLHGRFDVIHCGHINLMPVASTLGALRGTPISLVVHGIDAWQPPQNRSARMAARNADLVIAVSALTMERFRAWSGYPDAAGRVIPNTVHTDVFHPAPRDAALATLLGLDGHRVIMSLGRMASEERQKGFDEVLEVMPRLLAADPRIVYLVCGDGGDRPRLEAKARALGVADAVRFAGRVAEERKAAYYRLADAFVMPSSGEGFGIVLLEAMACGIPIVASCLDGTREAVRDGALGLVADPRDPDDLAAKILAAIAQPQGVPPGIDHFAPDRFAARWVDALVHAASRRPAATSSDPRTGTR